MDVSAQTRTEADVLSDFMLSVMRAAQAAREELSGAARPGSAAVSMAVMAGLEPRAWYSVAETVRYTGRPASQVYRAIRDGSLEAVVPDGQTRGYMVSAESCGRWLAGGGEGSHDE